MKYLLIILSTLLFFSSCEEKKDTGGVEKYEIAADKDSNDPYIEFHESDKQIEIEEAYPWKDDETPQQMLLDNPDKAMIKAAKIRFHDNGETFKIPEEIKPR